MSKRIHDLPEDVAEVMRALLPSLLPPVDQLDVSGLDDTIVNEAGCIVGEMISMTRWAFYMAVRFFDWVPFLLGFGFTRFTHMAVKQRARYIDHWALSSWALKRETFKMIRALLMMVYFSDRRVWAYLGYDPEPYMADKIKMHDEIVN